MSLSIEEAKNKVSYYVDRWTLPLGLRWWKIDIVYYDDPAEILRCFQWGEKITLAITTVSWMYAIATIDINLPAFANLDDDEIESAIVHELCHILVNEMREGEIHHEERVVTCLERAFQWTRKADKEEAKTEVVE